MMLKIRGCTLSYHPTWFWLGIKHAFEAIVRVFYYRIKIERPDGTLYHAEMFIGPIMLDWDDVPYYWEGNDGK